eukprot:CAMPEP_0117586988 /NCGR_PEP_ID=MMETSP0784-20121206/69030_1 /TAXON_ID=39447 /ORGANISM="" /LENGTH=59 /DNA_ID=CAMNT_0005388155 /DNA_START=35 /DNA_END=214 /DNA_ORIENTATION=+
MHLIVTVARDDVLGFPYAVPTHDATVRGLRPESEHVTASQDELAACDDVDVPAVHPDTL